MSNLKLTKVNQYRYPAGHRKVGEMCNVYTVSGDKDAVDQYVADQIATSPKGVQYHTDGKPLFWNDNLGETATRGKQGGWFINDELASALRSEVVKASAKGDTLMAELFAAELVKNKLAQIKAMQSFRSTPTPVSASASAEPGLDNV